MKEKLQAIRRRTPNALYMPQNLDQLRKRMEDEASSADDVFNVEGARPGDRCLAYVRAQGFEARMAEAMRRRPNIYTPFAPIPLSALSLSSTVASADASVSVKRPRSARLPSGYSDEYKNMKDKVHLVNRRPYLIPRPTPLTYDERMKREKEVEAKVKQDELRKKANKALMDKVDRIAQRPSPLYKLKYIYTD